MTDGLTPEMAAYREAVARALDTTGWWDFERWQPEYFGDTRAPDQRREAYRNQLRAKADAVLAVPHPEVAKVTALQREDGDLERAPITSEIEVERLRGALVNREETLLDRLASVEQINRAVMTERDKARGEVSRLQTQIDHAITRLGAVAADVVPGFHVKVGALRHVINILRGE